MKKLICVLLSFTLVFSTISFCVQEPLTAKAEERLIDSFINDTLEMIKENDKDKEFILDEESGISTLSTQAVNDENLDFQTCRLIVQAEKEIEKLNSTAIASGFMDYYIVQFATEEDAEEAYKYYSECNYVESVAPDGIFSTESIYTEVGNSYIEYSNNIPDKLDSWGSKATGMYEVKDYIESNYVVSELPKIKVAVIDTGVDLNHEFLHGRLIETGFNASSGGTANSEYDISDGHGTMVSSTIVDNTLSNVSIANYRVINDIGTTTTSAIASAIIKAFTDDSDFINLSLARNFSADAEYNLLNDAIKKACDSDCMIIAGAGNNHCDIDYNRVIPASNDSVFTVASSNHINFPSSFSNTGYDVNVSAPGEDIPVAYPNEKYRLVSGTSFSSPLTVAAASLLKTLDSQLTINQIRIKLESSATELDIEGQKDMWGYGVIDVIGASDIERAPTPSIHADKSEISISVPDGCEIYYTVDQTYPTKENGILYTEPFYLYDNIHIVHAVSYKDDVLTSKCASEQFKIPTMGTDDMFEIGDDGIITSYSGDVNYLSIPEEINEIKVNGFAESLFTNSTFCGLVIPETVKSIPINLFYNNSKIQFVDGYGIEEIEDSAFYLCENLYSANFPNLLTVGKGSFYYTTQLVGIDFPKCTYLGSEAFGCSTVRNINLPSVEIIHYRSFYKCACIYNLNVPNLMELRHKNYTSSGWIGGNYAFRESNICGVINFEKIEQVPYGTFFDANVKRLEFSNATTIGTLPIRYCRKPVFGTVSVVLPSTLKSCDIDIIPYDEQEDGIEYQIKFKVYGSKGTYAEQWATDNGYKFIEITPDNAVITDIPDEYYSYMRPLEADVVGFNRTYQWYGSDENNYSNGVAIKGATSREFDPNNFKSYKYYYCEVTSTVVGYEPIKIKTGICENKSYAPYVYTPEKYDASIKIQMPETRYLEYGESITLYASSTGLPDGANIRWRVVDGTGVSLSPTSAGNYCRVTAESSGNVIIEAYAVNKQGNLIYNLNGNRISDKTGISSEVTLWMIILQFIKKIFPFIQMTFSSLN